MPDKFQYATEKQPRLGWLAWAMECMYINNKPTRVLETLGHGSDVRMGVVFTIPLVFQGTKRRSNLHALPVDEGNRAFGSRVMFGLVVFVFCFCFVWLPPCCCFPSKIGSDCRHRKKFGHKVFPQLCNIVLRDCIAWSTETVLLIAVCTFLWVNPTRLNLTRRNSAFIA